MATIKGTWVFNDILTFTDRIQQSVNFVSNGNSGTLIIQTNSMGGGMSYKFSSMPTSVYDSGNWVDEAYRTVDFGSTEQEVSDDFYTWFTANATQIIETPKTTITYNGNEIASLEEGQSAIFPEGKKATDDVTITFGAKGSITYKGVTTDVEKGKTARLLFKGKKFGSDVVISTKAEEEEEDSIVGTWVFNSSIVAPSTDVEPAIYLLENSNGNDICILTEKSGSKYYIACNDYVANYSGVDFPFYYGISSVSRDSYLYTSGYNHSFSDIATCSIEFTDHVKSCIVNEEFVLWLKANATKQ